MRINAGAARLIGLMVIMGGVDISGGYVMERCPSG